MDVRISIRGRVLRGDEELPCVQSGAVACSLPERLVRGCRGSHGGRALSRRVRAVRRQRHSNEVYSFTLRSMVGLSLPVPQPFRV